MFNFKRFPENPFLLPDKDNDKVIALLLESNNSTNVISEINETLLQPEMDYEKVGHVYNVVFTCGALVINNEVYLYYGGADKVIGVAKMKLDEIFKSLGI